MAVRSLRSGSIVHIDMPATIADGAQTTHLGSSRSRSSGDGVDDILTATDAELVEAMRVFASTMKIVVEPTGCLASPPRARRATSRASGSACMVSGGNVDLDRYAALLAGRA